MFLKGTLKVLKIAITKLKITKREYLKKTKIKNNFILITSRRPLNKTIQVSKTTTTQISKYHLSLSVLFIRKA